MAPGDTPGPGGPDGAGPARNRTYRGRLRNFRTQLATAWDHPGNAGHRTRALARVVLFHVNAQLFGRRTCVPIGRHSKMWADRRFACTAELVLGNPPDWRYMRAWEDILGPGTLFVDVGANAGLYSLWAADLGSAVVSVEPEAQVRGALEENAALNGFDFEIVPAVLAEEAGVLRFTHGLGSMNHLMPGNPAGGVEVEARTLDEVLGDRTAHGVKIDVEGAEHLVLRGATRAMAERRLPVIQLEWNRASRRIFGEERQVVAELLAASGYELFRPDDRGRLRPTDAATLGSDVFAVLGAV